MNFLYEKKTNFAYKINSYTSRPPQMAITSKEIWILGRRFKGQNTETTDVIKTREQLDQLLSTIAWFSYTKNFDPISSGNNGSVITSDAGWGCMIRAGQMLLFTLLMRMFGDKNDINTDEASKLKYFLLKTYFREKITKNSSGSWIYGLIGSYKNQDVVNGKPPLITSDQLEEEPVPKRPERTQQDGNNPPEDETELPGSNCEASKKNKCHENSDHLGIFSLQNFASKANDLFQKPLGNWFRPTTFLLILKKILKTRPEFEDCAVHNVVENVFYLKSLAHKALGRTPEELSGIETIQDCIQMLCSTPWKRKVVLSITTLLGMDQTEARYQPILARLMELSSFTGMLGGYQQSAYYFVGKRSDDEFYFLDPHYVKTSLDDFEDTSKLERHFFDKKFLEINYNKMCSSVSIVFFLSGCDAFHELATALQDLENRYKEDFFLAYFLDKVDDRDLANDIISF
jgi:hypothetical protein